MILAVIIVVGVILCVALFGGGALLWSLVPSFVLGFALIAGYRMFVLKQPVFQKEGRVKFFVTAVVFGVIINFILRQFGIKFM